MKVWSIIKKNGLLVFLIILGIVLIFIALFGYEKNWKFVTDQISAAAACTVFTAVITMFLIKYNSRSDRELNKSQKVFEKKQEAYLDFIKELENIARDGKINISHFNDKNPNQEIFQDQIQDIIFQLNSVKLHCTNDQIMKPITDSVSNIIVSLNNFSSKIQVITEEKEKKEILYELYLQLEENIDVIIDYLWAD